MPAQTQTSSSTYRVERMPTEVANKALKKVCVVGLGNVGYPTASHIRKQGFSVYGYDINREKIANINPLPAFDAWEDVPDCNAYVVCVNTSWKHEKPDMTNIFDVCKKIAAREHETIPLVSIESTASVGTCRKVADLFNEVSLIHVPHRFWSEEPGKYGVMQLRVIGALDKKSLSIGSEFYKTLGVPLHPVSSLEVAEMAKIAENAYRFVQIAFAEQLRLICEQGEMNFEEVRDAANTKWNVNLLQALDGIGGDCLPKDIRFLMHLKDTPLLKGAIDTDKQYKNFLRAHYEHT